MRFPIAGVLCVLLLVPALGAQSAGREPAGPRIGGERADNTGRRRANAANTASVPELESALKRDPNNAELQVAARGRLLAAGRFFPRPRSVPACSQDRAGFGGSPQLARRRAARTIGLCRRHRGASQGHRARPQARPRLFEPRVGAGEERKSHRGRRGVSKGADARAKQRRARI